MIKKLAISICCSFIALYPAVSEAVTCQSGYILYKNACYKKLACKNGGTQQANKCKCKTGWTGTLCQTAATGYVDLGNGVLACAAGYKKSGDKCVAKPADRVGSYLANGMNNKTVKLNNTTDADVYGITTRDNVDVAVNNAYADRRDATAAISIINKGNGDVYGMANDESMGTNAYAYKGTANGRIAINNTGNGKVYGAIHDGDASSGYYNARAMRGGVAIGNIAIINKGNGGILGTNNNAYAAGDAAASGLVNLKNTGKGSVTGISGVNASAYSSGIASGTIKINNKGDGIIIGSSGSNANLSSNSSGEAHGYITITNEGKGGVYGSDSYNSYNSANKGISYGSIKITNKGAGQVVGSNNVNACKTDSYNKKNNAETYGYINISNTDNGDVYGTMSSNLSVNLSNYSNKKVYGSIAIKNNGNGKVVGATGYNVNSRNNDNVYGLINIANSGSGNTYGVTSDNYYQIYNVYGDAADIDKVSGRIKITNTGTGTAYGMYAARKDNSLLYIYNTRGGTGYIEMINKSTGTVYGMSGDKQYLEIESVNKDYTGKSYIKILNLGNGNGYAMDNLNSTRQYGEPLANISDGADKQSLIEMVNKGSGTVMAMRGKYRSDNSGTIKIHNLGSGTAVGMYVTGAYSTYIKNNKEYWHKNNGTIIIDRAAYTYDNGSAKTTDDVTYGASTARGGRAIGVYVTSDAFFQNNGTIQISDADTAYGIYAESGATVENNGTITIDGSSTAANCIKLNGAELFQNGLIQANSLNVNSVGGEVVASVTSRFEVKNDISGNLAMNSNVVSKGFDEKYTVKDMVKAADTSGLNLVSQSALFDAALENNSDAVMTMKSFNDVVENQSLAEFLKQNYAAQNNEELFDTLKNQHTAAALNSALDSLTGSKVFNRINFEDITIMRELNMDVNNTLFNNKEDNLVTAGSIAPFYFDGKSTADGKYALYNHRSGQNSYGLSFALTSIDSSDHHSNNTRKDETFQMSTPFGYGTNGFKFITAPRFGYAYGNYDRDGFAGKTYEGNVEKRMFGLMNEVRYPLKLGNWKIAPAAEFNMLGYHLKGNEDAQQYSLKIRSQNNYSVESGLGLYANRELKPSKNSTLRFNAGMAVYHEFADPYSVELGMNEMSGSFKLKDERRKDNRAVIRTGFDYSYGNITLNGNFATFVDGTTHNKAEIDLRYNF